MASIFTKIVQGEIPCFKIAEDEHFLAFLDIAPIEKGHTLVIPKKEIDYVFDLDEELYVGLHLFAKRVAHALEKTVPCQRIGQTVLGLEVPHAHLHLVPLIDVQFIDFRRRGTLDAAAFADLSAQIAANFE
ncbi:MAG: HIT family protein [Aureispira sp.]